MQNLLKFIGLLFLFGLFNGGVSTVSASKAISHTIFDNLLQKHVTPAGAVNYKGFIQDKQLFEEYLTLLQNNHPDKKNWSKNEQLAYWINAYNAFTVKIIIDNYPTKSIKDIKSGIPFINSVWDIKFINIEGQEYDLNNIEHTILRKEFDEPRIHFAINCASYSCPKLHTRAFTAKGLEEQLVERTRDFFADKQKNNIISKDKVVLSSIMKWYSTDFTDKGFFSWLFGGKERSENLIKFINPYVDIALSPNAEIEFMDYRWDLNE
ncbi:MAG: DUF547 domain-containing protein [Saprospiraceae bacterium]